MSNSISRQEKPILIIGGGLVGLAVAQGLNQHKLHVVVCERESPDQEQGWAVTVTFGLSYLQSLLPPALWNRVHETVVQRKVADHLGHLHFNGNTGRSAYQRDIKCRLRCSRDKLRKLLLEDVDVRYNKDLVAIDYQEDGVISTFSDGSSISGSCLIGADGAASTTRVLLCGAEEATRQELPLTALCVTAELTDIQAQPLLDLHPILFQASCPQQDVFVFNSLVASPALDEVDKKYTFQMFQSWTKSDTEPESGFLKSNGDRLALMKHNVKDWALPFCCMYNDISDTTPVRRVKVTSWEPRGWDNHNGRVTLAGDAAHGITMYRGEALSVGFVNATTLVRNLGQCFQTLNGASLSLATAIQNYEAAMLPRAAIATQLSVAAAMDGHTWGRLTNGPMFGMLWDAQRENFDLNKS